MSNYADNILDKDGNPIYLEDKHLNDQTSQTTVATTDAVMLKDTNGAYHSIDKASFNEAVRAAMGSILTNFDKGTSIERIPGIDSSNDLGSVTAANLASVLGVGGDNILRKTLGVNGEWDTGLSVGSSRGTTILALISYQWDAGDATASAIKGIRFGYTDSGSMQIEDVKVIGDNSGVRSETYSVSNNNTMVIKAGSGASLRILLLTNY